MVHFFFGTKSHLEELPGPDGSVGEGLGVTASFGMYMGDSCLVHCALADSGTLGVRPSAFQLQAMPPENRHSW